MILHLQEIFDALIFPFSTRVTQNKSCLKFEGLFRSERMKYFIYDGMNENKSCM